MSQKNEVVVTITQNLLVVLFRHFIDARTEYNPMRDLNIVRSSLIYLDQEVLQAWISESLNWVSKSFVA